MDKLEKKLWKKTFRYCRLLRAVPFLRFVGVCNSLAFSKVDDKSDIDLFIVARKNRLFIVRTLVTFLFHVFGVRRHGNKIAGRFCLSFFVDDHNLDLSEVAIDRDLYLAFWIFSMRPVLDDGVYIDFLNENAWVSEYFGSALVPRAKAKLSFSFIKRGFEFILFSNFADFIEARLRTWQLSRAKKRASLVEDASGLVISASVLKFHNLDRRRAYRDRWDDKYGKDVLLTRARFSRL
jgi:hypothetical protein